MPKEVEAVVLETTALNCSCTLNVHERYGDWQKKKKLTYVLKKQKKSDQIFAQKIKECLDCGINSSSSNWSYTLKH